MKTCLASWMNYFDINPVQLSEKTGVSQKMISKYLAGETTPSLEVCGILAKSFSITLDELVYSTPQASIDKIGTYHIIESTDIKVAVRLQNYFNKKNIKNEILVIKSCIIGSDKDRFVINYETEDILNPKDITKIVSKRKYSDKREKAKDDTKYTDMGVFGN